MDHDPWNEVVRRGIKEHLFTVMPFNLKAEYAIGNPKSGVTYYPFWESWALLLIEVALWLYLVSFAISLFPKTVSRD